MGFMELEPSSILYGIFQSVSLLPNDTRDNSGNPFLLTFLVSREISKLAFLENSVHVAIFLPAWFCTYVTQSLHLLLTRS